jgi:hypothetical protein
MYLGSRSPDGEDMKSIMQRNDFLHVFAEKIDVLTARYTRGVFTSELCKFKNKLNALREHLSEMLLDKYKLQDIFKLKSIADKSNKQIADDVYVIAHSLADKLPPCNNLDILYDFNIKPSGLIQLMYKVDMEVLQGGETLTDIAANIKLLAKGLETIMKDNKSIHEKLDLNTTAISTIQEEIAQIKESKATKEATMMYASNKKRRYDAEYPAQPLNSSSIPQKNIPKFSDLAKKLETFNFVSVKPKKTIIKGARKTDLIKSYNSDRRFEVWLGHINVNESDSNVKNLLKEIETVHNFDIKDVKKLDVTHKKFLSYKFSVPFADKIRIMDASLWPEDLAVSRFTSPNPNKIHERRTNELDRHTNEIMNYDQSNS